MPSEQAISFMNILKQQYIPHVDWSEMDYKAAREQAKANYTAGPMPDGMQVKDEILAGRPVERLFLPGASKKIIMHIHGGAMILGDEKCDRFMLAHIGLRSRRNTISIGYRLCPEVAYPAALHDCADVYCALLKEGHKPEDIALLGESAGGMLVLELLAYIKKNAMPMPGCACAISCSSDAMFQSQSMIRNQSTEFVVNANIKEMMQAIYYKDTDLKDPVVSPIYSDLSGWPPVYFYACREEILLDESVRMYIRLQEAGVETDISIVDGLFHTYMCYNIPESFEAFDRIAGFFNQH